MSGGPFIHPIEARSYEIMAARVDLTAWAAPGPRDVVARMVHATADESFARTARIGERAVPSAIAALAAGAAVICDARMVVAGVPGVARATAVECYLDVSGGPSPAASAPAPSRPDPSPPASHPVPEPSTRSAAAVDAAAADHPHGAVWVVGNAPTALARLVDLHSRGLVEPAAVIGLPVGYVGAAEAKEALWASDLAPLSITNRGPRGGSPVAAAALNTLGRLAGIS